MNPSNKGLLKELIKETNLKNLACEYCGKRFKEVWMSEVHLKAVEA